MVTDEVLPTPGEVATNEAARQAVILIFGVVTAMIVLRLQSKYARRIFESDPDAERTQRMSDARRLERAWNKVGTTISKAAVWAWRQADKAREAYDAERP